MQDASIRSASVQWLLRALPAGAEAQVRVDPRLPKDLLVTLGQRTLRGRMVSRTLASVLEAITAAPRPDFVVLSQMTAGVRETLLRAKIGWVDATGQVNIESGSIVVFREPSKPPELVSPSWTKSDIRAAEALLTGVAGTVQAVAAASALAASGTAKALNHLQSLGFLQSDAKRGRGAGRTVTDRGELLNAYVEAVSLQRPVPTLRVGVLWRDPLSEVMRLGQFWNAARVRWALTGPLAASQIAPLLTTLTPWELYVEGDSVSALQRAALEAKVAPDAGGRLLLRAAAPTMMPLPEIGSVKMPTVPWPRVYADLQSAGVRGEEAAEHLRNECLLRSGASQ